MSGIDVKHLLRPTTEAEVLAALSGPEHESHPERRRRTEEKRRQVRDLAATMRPGDELRFYDDQDWTALRWSCNTTCADSASGITLTAPREDLVTTATPDEMAQSREVRRAYDEERAREKQAHMDAVAAKVAQISSECCPFCGKACPSCRKTCKHCHRQVRSRVSDGDPAAT
jgi:hypothetical protein